MRSGPPDPRRPGHESDRKIRPGEQSLLFGKTPTFGPQAAVPRVVVVDRRMQIREAAERLLPAVRPQIARSGVQARRALGQLVVGVAGDLLGVDRETVALAKQELKGLR